MPDRIACKFYNDCYTDEDNNKTQQQAHLSYNSSPFLFRNKKSALARKQVTTHIGAHAYTISKKRHIGCIFNCAKHASQEPVCDNSIHTSFCLISTFKPGIKSLRGSSKKRLVTHQDI